MASSVGVLKILMLLLTLVVVLNGSPATRKIRKTPINFRYVDDLHAAATHHKGVYFVFLLIQLRMYVY